MKAKLEGLVEQAVTGDREALEQVISNIENRVFGLALRMLGDPDDAEDAAQEILIKVITHLAQFRQESAFPTWVYRIAVNYLLSTRKRKAEQHYTSFEEFAEEIDKGLASQWPKKLTEAEISLLAEEMMISCTQGMLLCLDRDLRATYVLGEIFQIPGKQGAFILNITPEAFRKRLSRARQRLHDFMHNNCGLVNPDNPCTCARQISDDAQTGQIDPSRLEFTAHPCRARHDPNALKRIQELDELKRASVIFRSHPDYAAPSNLMNGLKELMNSGRFELFNGEN